MAIRFGSVALDERGGLEVAGFLADRGMRPILILAEPWHQDFAKWTRDADAIVIAAGARSRESDAPYEVTRRGIRLLDTVDAAFLHIEYSVARNWTNPDIGSSIDATLDETHQEFTVALPDIALLNTPAGSHLFEQLQAQSKHKVALVAPADIARGPASLQQQLARLRTDGIEIAVFDFDSESQIDTIAEAVSDLRLVTGASLFARYLPASWSAATPVNPRRRSGGRGILVIAGSDSAITEAHHAWFTAHNAVIVPLDPLDIATGFVPDSVLTPISEELAEGGVCLLHIRPDTQQFLDYLNEQNKRDSEARESIARNLATFVRDLISLVTPEGLIVGGTHTVSIFARILDFGALAVGPNVELGVPVCVTLSDSALPVVLKPSDSSTADFYGKAIHAIRALGYLSDDNQARAHAGGLWQ